MPISGGDVVLTVTADSQQLDTLTAKLSNTLPSAANKAAKAVLDHAAAQAELRTQIKQAATETTLSAEAQIKLAEAETKAAVAAKAHSDAQRQLKQSLGLATENIREEKSEALLLGEAFGIKLPRAVRGFAAELPGVGTALQGAFAATAVGFLIEGLSQVPGKILEITNDLAGWTDEAKKAYAAQVKLNDSYLKLAQEKQIAEIRSNERALQGVALAKQQLANDEKIAVLTGKRVGDEGKVQSVLEKQKSEIEQQVESLQKLSLLIVGTRLPDSFIKLGVKDQLAQLESDLERAKQKVYEYEADKTKIEDKGKDDEAHLRKESLDDFIKNESAKVEARKNTSNAFLQLAIADAAVEYGQRKITYLDFLTLQATANEAQLQNTVNALRDKNELLAKDYEKNKDQIIANNAQIIDVQLQHYAKVKTELAASLKEFNKLAQEARNELIAHPLVVEITVNPLKGGIIEAFEQIDQALRNIGLKSLPKMREEAQSAATAIDTISKAYDTLIKLADTASAKDGIRAEKEAAILAASIKQKELEIELAHQRGESAQEEQKQLDKLLDKWAALTGAVRSNQKELDIWKKNSKKDFDAVGEAVTHFEQRAKGALDVVFGALQQAIAEAILGQDTFVHALRKALAQQLATWAAQDAISAIRETALGFALLAIGDGAGAGHAFTSAAIYGSAAAAEGASAYALNPKDAASGGTQLAGTPIETAGSQTPVQQQPVAISNTRHFASGGIASGLDVGLLSSPTVYSVMVGDSRSGGSQREAVIPMEDPTGRRLIAESIVDLLPEGALGTNHNYHIVVNGASRSDVRKLAREVSKDVGNGKVRFTSSNSFRVTKRG